MDENRVRIEFQSSSGKLEIVYPDGLTRAPKPGHPAFCQCWRCFANAMGGFIDELASKTASGQWSLFLTQSYKTPTYPWAKGFPRRSEPHPDFVHHFPHFMMSWLEREFGSGFEYFYADQYGETGGRLHQHFGISSPAIIQPSAELASLRKAGRKCLPEILRPLQQMLWERAGFHRILPWVYPASFYIGRYIGRDAARCHWEWRVGADDRQAPLVKSAIGREVVAPSSDIPSKHFRNVLGRWHR